MTAYGYRLSQFSITKEGELAPTIDFSSPLMPGSNANSWLYQGILGAKSLGRVDTKTSTYFKIDSVVQDGWCIGVVGSGGHFGQPASVVDTVTHQAVPNKDILAAEAVLRDGRILLFIPPSMDVAVAVYEVQGNSSFQTPFFDLIDEFARSAGRAIRVDTDLADEVAWLKYLTNQNVEISGVELVQKGHSVDRAFKDSVGVKRFGLDVSIEPGGRKSKKILKELQSSLGKGKSVPLAKILGMKGYAQYHFDQQKIHTLQDGKNRTIDITSGWPRFVYRISETNRPTDAEFLSACIGSVSDVFQQNKVSTVANWWPSKIR